MSDYNDNYDDYMDHGVETRTEYSVGTTNTRQSKGTTATGFNDNTNATSSKPGAGANTSSAFGWWGGGTNTGVASGVGSTSSAYDGLSMGNRILQTEGIDHEQKVREGFSILAQGVELIHFETANMIVGGNKNKKIVWMVCSIIV